VFSEITENMSHWLQELSSGPKVAAYGVLVWAGPHHVPSGFVHAAVELAGFVV
jgi:hypothetical protein